MISNNRLLFFRYRALYPLLSKLPLAVSEYLIKKIAIRRQDAISLSTEGLKTVFPDKTPNELLDYSIHLQYLMERELRDVYWLNSITKSNSAQYVDNSGLNNFLKFYNAGRPVILYSGHMGRLIMPIMALGANGITSSCLTADIERPQFPIEERRFLRRKLAAMQRLMKGRIITKSDNYRGLYKALKEEKILIIIIDAPPAEGDTLMRVPFLGGYYLTSPGIVRLARRTGAALIPYFGLDSVSMVEGHFLPEVKIDGLSEAEALRAVFEPLEGMVLKHPDQWWLWGSFKHLWVREV